MSKPSVVILVDLPHRDLMGDALIAHELGKLGIECFLEPLESWQAAVYAYKPNLILYNHLTTSKFARFTQVLKGYGVLVGCLLNEGLAYEKSAREYVSKKQDPDFHCDLYLCWNDHHRQALIAHEFCSPPEMARTVGCPRFDFYKQPFSQLYSSEKNPDGRSTILINTTFALAHYHTMPRENADRFFAGWKDKIAGLQNYMEVVKAHYVGRENLPARVQPLLATGRYRIIIRPHPREELAFYHNWIAGLPSELQPLVSLSTREPPMRPILCSDVVVNCEDCTTAMEAWLADKPTISIALERHPYWFTETYKRLSPIAESGEDLLQQVEEALRNPLQESFRSQREAHLNEWLFSCDGKSAQRAAEEINQLIRTRANSPQIPFSLRTSWKKWKLRILGLVDEPYNSRPGHFLRKMLNWKQEQVSIKYRDYLKAIRPSDAARARTKVDEVGRQYAARTK